MAALSPVEVEQWLLGLKSLLSGEAVRELANEVRRNQMDGAAFGALVASRTTPASVRPSHMATIRRCWNSDRPQGKGESSASRSGQRQRREDGRNGAEVRTSGEQARVAPKEATDFWEAPRRVPHANNGHRSRPMDAPPERQQTNGPPKQFVPPPREIQKQVANVEAVAERVDVPPVPLPAELPSPPAQPSRRIEQERKIGECHDKVDRPPQVPRLDLSSIHAKEGDGGKAEKLGTQQWNKPRRQPWNEVGPQYPAPNVDKKAAAMERAEQGPQPQGFACASCEDQQRIAEFYGYRDEGFVATMHGLKTDCIRARLYLGTMADAAYWPLLQSLCITHILNCAIEAQRADPPYDSQGIAYFMVPWHDSQEQTHSLARQRFRQLREATRYIDRSLKSTFQVKGTEKKASVLVHCVQGLNRSAAIVCAYLMEYEDCSLDRALAEVRGKHRGCLSSRHWQDLLHKFNAELLRGM